MLQKKIEFTTSISKEWNSCEPSRVDKGLSEELKNESNFNYKIRLSKNFTWEK